MTSPIKSLSVVLPVYNEQAAIVDTITKINQHLYSLIDTFEIIVVNDGSSDDTAIKLKQLQTQYPHLKVITHATNRGYGETLRTGFNHAQYEWIFQTDSDGQFDIRELNKFIAEAATYNIIIGYRQHRADAWHRVLLTWGYMGLIRIMFNLKVNDVGCAYKLFQQEVWHKAQPIQSRDHKIFLVEWICKLQHLGLTIKELPVSHYHRSGGRPSGAKPRVFWATIKQLVYLKTQECLKPKAYHQHKDKL